VTRGICTTNNRLKRSRIFDSKTKTWIKFYSRTGNTWFTPGIKVWSADRKFWFFLDSHGYEREFILIGNMVFGLVPTPAKHVLLVHINMSLGLNIHQGLKIRFIFTRKQSHNQIVNVEKNRHNILIETSFILMQQSHMRFESWGNFQNESISKKCTCIFGTIPRFEPGTSPFSDGVAATLSYGPRWTGGASDRVKAKSSGEDPRATGGFCPNLPHPRVNKTKQHSCVSGLSLLI